MNGTLRRPAGAGGRVRGVVLTGGYLLLLALVSVLSVAGLVIGAVVAAADRFKSVADELDGAAAAGSRWAGAVLAAVPTSEPPSQLLLDYGFSLVSISLAVALLALRERTWSIRLFALAVIGTAGAFNLQAYAAATAVETGSGLAIGLLHQVLLPGISCAAYILALTVFPTAGDPDRAGLARGALIAVGGGTLLLVGTGTALLPQATACVLFFGFLVPLAGLTALPGNIRHAQLAVVRTQSRLLFSVLAGAFAVTVVLTLITALLWWFGWTGFTLVDPTVRTPGFSDLPIALLFWFSRLACIAIAGAVLVATSRGGSWTAEHLFSRGLVAALVASVIAGGHIVLRTLLSPVIGESTPGRALTLAAVSTVPVALVFLPLYVRAERVVDRLLYGSRPTPYSVLAGIAALSRGTTSTGAPDLARVAEAVGRGVGATTCRLTVLRPGLRDRVYAWSAPGTTAVPAVEVPVRHGAERIGTIEVDQGAVAGLHGQRQHLLEDVADSLGVVFQASRSGIELERQLRAALAYAGGIAVSRRAVVAEMDWERRRIERDLHDGAQHHLVSLRLALGLVEHQVSTSQLEQARSRLTQIADQIEVAEEILAETAKGVSSPLLAELGLVRALRQELGGGQPPVAVDSAAVDEEVRIPSDVEAAVYFCCLEAVNNARKHAPGAAIGVRLETDDGRLRFTVRDEGPGWDMRNAPASAGRGLRNVAARVTAVGGRVDIRSELGVGTTVEGSAPVRAAEPEPDAPDPGPGFRAGAAARMSASVSFLDLVRDAMRAARELYHGTPRADALRELAERLDEPLRVAVGGPPGAGSTTLVDALRAAFEAARLKAHEERPAVRLIDTSGAGTTASTQKILVHGAGPSALADASVLLLRDRRVENGSPGEPPRQRSGLTIGVLARVDELGAVGPTGEGMELAERAAAEWATRPEVRRRCSVVVPVAGLLAAAAASLTDEQYQALRRLDAASAGDLVTVPAGPARPTPTKRPQVPVVDPADENALVDRFGPAGVRLATTLIRSGRAPTAAALAVELTRHSGLPRLIEQIESRLCRRAEGLKARSALRALETLVRTEPPPVGGDGLRYRFDRIRSGTHELTELDLVDALRSGELDLTDEQRESAERLLGAMGPDPRTRLALAPDAGSQEIAMVAGEQLAHWHALAAHPVSGKVVRDVAAIVVQSCEQLLAAASR